MAIWKESLVQGGGPRGFFCLFHPVLQLTQPRANLGEGQKSEYGNAGGPEKSHTFQGKARSPVSPGAGSWWREVAHGREQ